jgi:fructose-1-phosphate kinase PfkB-like protein
MIGHGVSGSSYLCVGLNPVIQKTLVYDQLERGEVNRTADWRIDAAGKGVCTVRVLTQSGERAATLAQLGGPTRDWFLSLCAADGLRVVWAESGAPIRFCTTILERGNSMATEMVEEAVPVHPDTTERLVQAFMSELPAIDVVMLSGTTAAGFETGLMGRLAQLARKAGKRLYLDLKGQDLRDCLEAGAACAKPNLEELAATMKVPYASVRHDQAARDLVARAGRDFHERYGCALVVTRGTDPTLFWDGGCVREQAAMNVPWANPIGSGDAFGAGLARALECGASLADAVAEGARLGGLNASTLKPGSILADRV